LCGRRRWREGAQLALMDAMVFFAVSMVICATLASYSASQGADVADETEAFTDPDGLLAVYLRASLGKEFVLEGPGLVLTGREQFSETLYLVCALVVQGLNIEEFELVLTHCHLVISGLCDSWYAILRLSLAATTGWTVLAELGEEASSDSLAASQNLGVCGGSQLVVTLILHPALLLH
jgi:hypothetical protein